MTTDLDDRIRTALTDAAATTRVSDDAFATIVRRAEETTAGRRPTRLIVAGGLAGATVTAAVAFTVLDRGAAPSTLAAVGRPPIATEPAEACGAPTSSRAATAGEVARFDDVLSELPDGYRLADSGAWAEVRTAPCEYADAAYLDPATGRLLWATLRPTEGRLLSTSSGIEADPANPCVLPEGWRPARCVLLGESLVWLSDEGTKATLSWFTAGGDYVFVTAYGFTTDELLAAAGTLDFDGTDLSLQPPAGMAQVAAIPRIVADDSPFDHVRYVAELVHDATGHHVRVHISEVLAPGPPDGPFILDVGPAAVVDLDGVEAIAVTTRGPGTGIHAWTSPPGADPMVEQVPEDPEALPAEAVVTWRLDGLAFSIYGPDVEIVTTIARHLRPA